MRNSTPVKISMDQSTQVNFPTVMQNPKKQTMKRHNTSGEIILQNKGTQLTANTWVNWKQQSLPRPKSLNFQSDGFKTKLYTDSQISQLSLPIPESNVSSLSKERSPAYSCNSSIISMSKNGYKPYLPPKLRYGHQDEESNGGSCKCYCKCYEIDKEHPKIAPSNTKQGLSWRRLHMSRAKLKATSTTSELLSGFAMVAMVELQINEETGVPEWLFVMFAVCTTVLVSVHIFALMISTYILPNIDAIAKLEICEMVAESPHERMRGFIELAWAFSTVLGLFLFLVEIAILCWVKFWDYSFPAAIAATVIVIPVLVIFVIFTVHFYHSLVVYKCNTSLDDMEKLESMKKQLDEISSPV